MPTSTLWNNNNGSSPTIFRSIITLTLLLLTVTRVESYLRYTEQSCVDLTPRSFDDYTNAENHYTSSTSTSTKSRFPARKRKRHNGFGEDGIPFKITATGRRYRRDRDVVGT